VRFDANQGYSYTEARSFLRAIETHLAEQTELVEQPLPPAAWNDMAQLAQHTTVPLMLDESIYTGEDVDRAVQVGCQWIKLKLCKQGGAQELLRIAEYAKQLGLGVVIGNGVATDIVNLLELQLYHRHAHLFNGASESNGFAKLQHPVLHKALSVESGCALWEENSAPFSNSSTMTTG
jgi:L-alanine-DL-glutamate epimerase-like enolase superfamily enzyme